MSCRQLAHRIMASPFRAATPVRPERAGGVAVTVGPCMVTAAGGGSPREVRVLGRVVNRNKPFASGRLVESTRFAAVRAVQGWRTVPGAEGGHEVISIDAPALAARPSASR